MCKYYFEVVKTYDIEMFLPLYEGGILLSAMVSTKANLNFYSIPTALASRNKYYLKQVMQLYGVPVPNSVPVYRFTPYSYISNIIGENFILLGQLSTILFHKIIYCSDV